MDFQTLQSHVENYLLDVPAETSQLVPDWINMAVRQAADRHNFQFMKAETELETVEDQRELGDIPDGWKERRYPPWLQHQDGSVTEIRWAPSESEMVRAFGQAQPAQGSSVPADRGSPEFILEQDSTLEVFPFPDSRADWDNGEYRVVVPYWSEPAELSANTDANWITENMPFYVIFFAAAEGFLFNRDEERSKYYQQRAEEQFLRGRKADKRKQLPDRLILAPRSGARGGPKSRRIGQ